MTSTNALHEASGALAGAVEGTYSGDVLIMLSLPAARALYDLTQDQAALDVLAERARQIEVEGWTPEHDDKYVSSALADAAAAYAMSPEMRRRSRLAAGLPTDENGYPACWPFDTEWWKPGDRCRMLQKAGALIIAELGRIYRAAER